ncbi:MAG: hypothetical protein ACOX3S_08940 [Anaerolineae bacterium]|jgi:anti-sigma factor RsiW
MTDCRRYDDQLAELAASGADAPTDAALQAHLALCPRCRAELARLRCAELVLRAWPLAPLPRDLVAPVLARIAPLPAEPAWQLLPWTVWVPALAIALTVGIVLAANLVGLSLPESAPLDVALTAPTLPTMASLRQPLSAAGRDLFWSIWFGLFFTMAGVGVSLALMARPRQLDDLTADLRERWQALRESAHL